MTQPKLELTWIGKSHRPKLEPRILLEDPAKSYHAATRVSDADYFDNRLIFGDNLLALRALESEFADSCPFQIAEVYAARNEPTAAFKWLDHAWQVREGGIGWVRVAKTLKNLHGDPRWQDFLRKVGLHDEQLK